MATSLEFIEFVCEQIRGNLPVRYRKMFGEYMVYVADKPILLVCDDTVFVKILPETEKLLSNAERGIPYAGSKPHFILDIEDRELALEVISVLERVTPLPKKKVKK